MKKLLLIAAMCLAGLAVSAQSLTVTPKAGLNFANVTKSEGDMKLGFVAGAEADYQVTENFAIGAGLLFSMQGAKEKGEGDALNLNYINIPILAGYEVYQGLKVKAGIQPSFLMSAKVGSEDVKEYYKSLDLAIPVGLSYEISSIVVDARYNIGLTKVYKDYEGDGGKNTVFRLTVGYKFAL